MLRDGNTTADQTDHGACLSVALAMYRAGHTEADFVREMSEPTNRLSEHYRLKDPERGRTTRRHRGVAAAVVKMRRDWAKAVEVALSKPQVHNRTEALQQLGCFRATIDAAAWLGAYLNSLKSLLLVLVAVGIKQGSMTPTISTRNLGMEIGCHEGTVSRRTKALETLGWIKVIDSGDRTMPNSYRLLIPTAASRDTDSPTVPSRNTSLALARGARGVARWDTSDVPVLDLDPDVREVSGTSAALVLAAVAAGARGVTEIRRWTGLARQTIYRHLPRLAKAKLLATDRVGRWVRTSRSVMTELGREAQVRRAKRAERHAAARVAWQDRLLRRPWTVFGRRGSAEWARAAMVQALVGAADGA